MGLDMFIDQTTIIYCVAVYKYVAPFGLSTTPQSEDTQYFVD